jgi:putative DNA primase/helicase
MSTQTTDDPITMVLDRLSGFRQSGNYWTAICPAHDDRSPSLSVAIGNDGRVLLKCHAGCTVEDIVLALNLTMADLFPHPREVGALSTNAGSQGWSEIVATYDYRDEDGELLYQVVRKPSKGFSQRRPDENGGWIWSLDGVRRVPFQLPGLLAADSAQPVLIVEGEKDVLRLELAGFVATTNSGGAGNWRPELNDHFKGRTVIIIPDNDSAGRKHASQVARNLLGVAEDVHILALPDLAEKGDASDWFAAGGTKEALECLIAIAPLWMPEDSDGVNADDSEENGEEAAIWREPTPIEDGERPEFPVEHLPGPIRRFTEQLARSTQTPVALVALMVLAAIAIVLAKRLVVHVRDDWYEPLNFYTGVALPPGNRKSAVVSAVSEPHRQFERDEAERMIVEIAQARSRRDLAEKRLEHLKRQYVKEKNADLRFALESDIDDLAQELATDPSLQVPTPPRLLVDDITPEKLAALMADNGSRMGVLSAEGGLADIIAGRYSDNDSLDLFLKGHSGEDVAIDRIGREAKHLRAPAITLGLAVQPTVFRGLFRHKEFRGKGLLARFAFALPISTVGHREITPPPMVLAVKLEYQQLILAALSLAPAQSTLVFSEKASAAFIDFQRRLEPRIGPSGDLGHIADWGGKLAGLVARLAGIFHTIHAIARNIEPSSKHITTASLLPAIRIAEDFLIPHALTVFGLMGADPAIEEAQRVLHVLQSWPELTFSRRDLHQKLRGSFPRPENLDPPLALLIDYGYLRVLPVEPKLGAGRKPSPHFLMNPLWHAQNTQNGRGRGPRSHFEDCVHSERGINDRNNTVNEHVLSTNGACDDPIVLYEEGII